MWSNDDVFEQEFGSRIFLKPFGNPIPYLVERIKRSGICSIDYHDSRLLSDNLHKFLFLDAGTDRIEKSLIEITHYIRPQKGTCLNRL
jgi:hypothetical protein